MSFVQEILLIENMKTTIKFSGYIYWQY